MDLKTGPLARFLLLERDGHSEFWICVEHLVADGWSLDVITREIQEAYADPSHLWQPVAIQNHKYGVFENHYCESDTGRRAKAFWERRLAGGSPWLALDYPGAGGVEQLNESSALWEQTRLDIGQARLAQASRAGRLTPYVMLLSSMCRAVSRGGGLTVVPVMSPIANRGAAELESTVTWCSNIMPCAIEMNSAAGQLDEFRSIRNQLAEFASFASYPIHRLMRELVPHLWGLARPTVPFLYFDVEMSSSEFSLGNTEVEDMTPPTAPIVRGLVIWCRIDEDGLDLQFGCGEGFLPAAELRSLLGETAEEITKAVAVLT
jgi:hypothetical protein